jgi:hypothetical protein
MRTEKELFKLMLERQDKFSTTLCALNGSMYHDNIITLDECLMLHLYIKNNRPSMFSSLSAFRNRNNIFYWDFWDIEPRIKWINKQIEKL